MLGLYIHIPFCKHVCFYCDFYKMVVSDKFKEKYIHYLIKEIELIKINELAFDTIYIGGGTPSALPISTLEILLKEINNNVNINDIKEFTIELNPEDINLELINLLLKYHINRISIGIQSFSKKVMTILGRKHFNFNEIKEKIELIRSAGITNISCDLIYGVCGETLEEVSLDLEYLLKLDVPHISTYSLILEEKTILYEKYKKHQFFLTNEELDEKMYQVICDTLKKHNFIHYETSNFGKNGYQSKHNLKYWNSENYIGIGSGASSYYNHKRYTNIRNINSYYEGIDNRKLIFQDVETLSVEDELDEMIMLGLRKSEGVNKQVFYDKFKIEIKTVFNSIDSLIEQGLLEENENYIYIPEKYSYIANHIIIKII